MLTRLPSQVHPTVAIAAVEMNARRRFEHLRLRLRRMPAAESALAEWALIVGKLDHRHFGRLFPHIRSAGDADKDVLKGRLLAHEDEFYDLNVLLDLLLT